MKMVHSTVKAEKFLNEFIENTERYLTNRPSDEACALDAIHDIAVDPAAYANQLMDAVRLAREALDDLRQQDVDLSPRLV